LDEGFFFVGGGLVLGDVAVEMLLVDGGIAGGEKNGAASEAGFDGVQGRFGFAFGAELLLRTQRADEARAVSKTEKRESSPARHFHRARDLGVRFPSVISDIPGLRRCKPFLHLISQLVQELIELRMAF
jgi:hypothetical protein